MSKWDELRKECYGKDIIERYQNGRIDFSPDSMRDVENGDFKSYDEYLEVQERSCDEVRQFFELCYYRVSGAYADFKGQILRFDQQKNKVLFKRIMVNGMYGDGIGFIGKEDHVWMDRNGFELFNPGDCLRFEADVYRYMRKSAGKRIDYGLRNPDNIEKIEPYEVPTDEQLIDQQINQLVCETCRYFDHCYLGMCVANEEERKERFETLKNFQPGKFTPFTVMLAYELEYRVIMQDKNFRCDPTAPNFPIIKKMLDICQAHPVYYVGNPQEAFVKMLFSDKPRMYIE
ncbi:hypothetical protein [Clostridium sp.]